MADTVFCSVDDCAKRSRARGLCDTHYSMRRRREKGVGGIDPLDDTVWKVRVRLPSGATQPYYYSKRDAADAKAAEAMKTGSLLFFGEFTFVKKFEVSP